MSLYKRLFAWGMHRFRKRNAHPDDPFTRDVRIPLLAQARGQVLEIGAGEGANLAFYPSGVSLTLLDPNPFMLRYLEETAADLGLQAYTVVNGRGEELPFADASLDTVVAVHVLCSVRDQTQVLAEVRRVLRPGGQFLFLEHVAAPPDTPVHRLQRLINPVWKLVGDGCHLTRDTAAVILAAGFGTVKVFPYQAGYPSIVSTHVFGTAQV